MHEVLLDEIASATEQVKKIERFKKKKGYFEYFIVNNCPFGDFTHCIFRRANAAAGQRYVVDCANESVGAFSEGNCETVNDEDIVDTACFVKSVIYFFVDCRNAAYENVEKRDFLLNRLKKWLRISGNGINCKFLLIPLLCLPQELPENVTSLAEREYDYYLFNKKKEWGEDLYVEMERLCREEVKRGKAKIDILRFGNIFGPGVDLLEKMSIQSMVINAFHNLSIELNPEDSSDIYSYTYLRDAVASVAVCTRSGKHGHVYNVSGYSLSLKQIKLSMQASFPEKLALHAKIDRQENLKYHTLNSLKIKKCGWKPEVTAKEAIYRTVIYYLNKPYDMERKLSIYSGRLDKIKKLELGTLKFVDKVCRENNIHYFLAGGSLLGAVRHHGIIPWDDDLDIGMLREDFEKFRRICPGLTQDLYSYESPQDGNGSHYCFDKIRLKNTYFSTNYSSNFAIQDGIFLDVIIYDQTSNLKFFSKLQIWLIAVWTKLINVKWLNRPRRNDHYKLTKFALPVIRLMPFSFCHYVFEKLVRFYEKKKNAKFLIDGIGQNIRKGPFPKGWLTNITYVPFEDMQAPIPVGYDGYLRHFYGSHYMDLLPISKRVSGHNIARIDLGGYLYNDSTFRDVDIRGELFEVVAEIEKD